MALLWKFRGKKIASYPSHKPSNRRKLLKKFIFINFLSVREKTKYFLTIL